MDINKKIFDKECISSWVDNLQPNGCYQHHGAHHCESQLGCVKDADKHTFKEVCRSSTIPPVSAPSCPPGWGLSSANSRIWDCAGDPSACIDSGFDCETCVAAGCFHSQGGTHCGPDFCIPVPITTTAAPTTTTLSTMQSTTPAITLPPFEHIWHSPGCPDGFFLEHNNGSLSFDCRFGGGQGGASCDNLGNCTSGSMTAKEVCEQAMTSGILKIYSTQ